MYIKWVLSCSSKHKACKWTTYIQPTETRINLFFKFDKARGIQSMWHRKQAHGTQQEESSLVTSHVSKELRQVNWKGKKEKKKPAHILTQNSLIENPKKKSILDRNLVINQIDHLEASGL